MGEKKLEVVFFYQYFGTPKGSWSTRVYEFCKRWRNAGYNVTVVTSPYDKSDIRADKFISRQNIEGINLIIINSADSNKDSISKRVFKAIQFSLVSMWYALTLKYNVCIASSGPITIGLPMIVAKKLRRKKTVFEVRDLWPAGAIELDIIKSKWQISLGLWFERLCYNSADFIITASVGQKKHIADNFPNKSIRVIPNASDIELFGTKAIGSLPSWTKDKVIFTHIGSLGLIHNIDYWISVAEELTTLDINKEVMLVFIGDGRDRGRLAERINYLKLTNVVFMGLMPKVDLPIWVQHSRATLFATLDNPVQSTCSPNKIFDSFASGVPIVQTTTGWIRDLVNERQCGVNVNLNNPKGAAVNILALSEDKALAQRLGSNASELASEEFNRDKLAVEYLNYLEELIDE